MNFFKEVSYFATLIPKDDVFNNNSFDRPACEYSG